MSRRMERLALMALLAAPIAGGGCRGQISARPPRHLISDMDWQNKVRPQQESPFFADHRGMRPLVEGTVAQGALKEDPAFYQGVDPITRKPVTQAPVTVDEKLLRRGQERFNIYCSPCHDRTGSGHGLVVQRGYPPPPDLPLRQASMADGEIFQTISHGVRNMPAYNLQVPEGDRWAIVAYLRVLGRSQHTAIADVPPEMQGKIEPEGATK